MPGIHRYPDIYELLAENYALRHEVRDLKSERRNLRSSKSALKKDVEKLADRAREMNETNVGLQEKLKELEAALKRLEVRASAAAGRRSHSDRGTNYEANDSERRPVNDNGSNQRRMFDDRAHGPCSSASVSKPSAISVPRARGASLGRTQRPSLEVATPPHKRRNKDDDDEYEFVPDDAEVAIEDERYEYMELSISRTELGNIFQPSDPEEPIVRKCRQSFSGFVEHDQRMEDYRATPTPSLPATCARQQPVSALPVSVEYPHQPAPPKLQSPAAMQPAVNLKRPLPRGLILFTPADARATATSPAFHLPPASPAATTPPSSPLSPSTSNAPLSPTPTTPTTPRPRALLSTTDSKGSHRDVKFIKRW